jgi:hypothetical protein
MNTVRTTVESSTLVNPAFQRGAEAGALTGIETVSTVLFSVAVAPNCSGLHQFALVCTKQKI